MSAPPFQLLVTGSRLAPATLLGRLTSLHDKEPAVDTMLEVKNSSEVMGWVVHAFLLLYFLLFVAVLAALIRTLSTHRRRGKGSHNRAEHAVYSMKGGLERCQDGNAVNSGIHYEDRAA